VNEALSPSYRIARFGRAPHVAASLVAAFAVALSTGTVAQADAASSTNKPAAHTATRQPSMSTKSRTGYGARSRKPWYRCYGAVTKP